MKKLLTILGSTSLVLTTSATIVSCGSNVNDNQNIDESHKEKLLIAKSHLSKTINEAKQKLKDNDNNFDTYKLFVRKIDNSTNVYNSSRNLKEIEDTNIMLGNEILKYDDNLEAEKEGSIVSVELLIERVEKLKSTIVSETEKRMEFIEPLVTLELEKVENRIKEGKVDKFTKAELELKMDYLETLYNGHKLKQNATVLHIIELCLKQKKDFKTLFMNYATAASKGEDMKDEEFSGAKEPNEDAPNYGLSSLYMRSQEQNNGQLVLSVTYYKADDNTSKMWFGSTIKSESFKGKEYNEILEISLKTWTISPGLPTEWQDKQYEFYMENIYPLV